MGVGGQHEGPATLRPGKRKGTHCTVAGWASASVGMSPKNLAPTGIRHLDRAARNGSIYLLRYPGDSIRTVRYVNNSLCLLPFLPVVPTQFSNITASCYEKVFTLKVHIC